MNKKLLRFFHSFCLFFLAFSLHTRAACTLTAKCTGGAWSNPSTWTCSSCGVITAPSSGCIIIIPACSTVDVDINSPEYVNMEIYVYGNLNFDVGQKINMCPGYIKVFAGGQLGGSNPGAKINICGTTVWDGGGNTAGPVEYGGGTTLPIELTYFNAIFNAGKVDISWETASETNNDFFTVERSLNAIDFEPLIVTNGAGNSTSTIQYNEIDYHPFEGISYYRLKQTDYNGHSGYSSVVPVNYVFGGDFVIYPNPASSGDDVNVTINIPPGKEVLVVVRDISGKEFYSKVIINHSGDQLIAIDPEHNIASGTYIVMASSENKMYSKKLIIQ